MMVREVGENKSEQQVIDDIADCGWHCINIHPEGQRCTRRWLRVPLC